MSTITQPKAHIPIGSVVINGVSLDVTPHPELVRFFESLMKRVGGTSGTGTDELALSQFEDAGIEETKATLFAVRDEYGQLPPLVLSPPPEDPSGELSALREELAALRSRVAALEQGTTA